MWAMKVQAPPDMGGRRIQMTCFKQAGKSWVWMSEMRGHLANDLLRFFLFLSWKCHLFNIQYWCGKHLFWWITVLWKTQFPCKIPSQQYYHYHKLLSFRVQSGSCRSQWKNIWFQWALVRIRQLLLYLAYESCSETAIVVWTQKSLTGRKSVAFLESWLMHSSFYVP